jgi:hypothetical protein
MDKLNLIDCLVTNRTYGDGKVTEVSDTYIRVRFGECEKKFQYPMAFESILTCKDVNLQDKLQSIILKHKEQDKEKSHYQIKVNADNLIAKPAIISASGRKIKVYHKENIAFKCNYCDGGQNQNGIGYIEACSDATMKYNIEVAQHRWCSCEESLCKQYYDGIISRKELDDVRTEGGFVCYESKMLDTWTAYAGAVLTNGDVHKPMKLNKVQVNSLAVLTTRDIGTSESERFVFGVFLVDEAYEGDNRDEGYVTTNSKYKISLNKIEASKILFWNYYANENAPQKAVWGQGLHRYISDIQAASILKDILEVKRGTKDEELAQEFCEYFCNINSIDFDDMPVREGALQRK